MLHTYIKEFQAVVAFLIENSKAAIVKGFIIIDKKDLELLLNQNKYDTAGNKLKIWKALHWIDTDERRYTRRIYDNKLKRYVPRIKIYESVYATIKELLK